MDKLPTELTREKVIEEFRRKPVRDYLSVDGVDREVSKPNNWKHICEDFDKFEVRTVARLREVIDSVEILDALKEIYVGEFTPPRDPNAPLDPCGIITWGFYFLSNGISFETKQYVR